jgi:hypothetical protein
MSFISQKYFNFATKLMRLVRKYTSEEMLLREQCDYIKNGKALIANDSDLKEEFLKIDTDSCLKRKDRLKVFEQLWHKIFHARAGAVTHAFKDDRDNRHHKNGLGGEAFRTTLKVGAIGTTTAKVEKLKAKIRRVI